MAASSVFGRTPSGTITVATEALSAYRRIATKCGICGLEIKGPEILRFPNHRMHDEGGCFEQHAADCPACVKNGLGNGVTAFCLHYKRADGTDNYMWMTEVEVSMMLAKRQALRPNDIAPAPVKTSEITSSAESARQHFQSSRASLPMVDATIEQCNRAVGIVERIRKITGSNTPGKIDDVELRMVAQELASLFSAMAADKAMNREQVLDAFADAGGAIDKIRASRK